MRFLTILLLLIYTNLCSALGFGEVELKSHLGEELHASIDVTDLDSHSESSCFAVSDTSEVAAFKKVNISLKPNATGHQLTITSNDVVTEPIVSLHVSFQCEPNLSREYTLLLDPALPPSVNKVVAEESINVEPIVNKVTEVKSQNHNAIDQITEKYSAEAIPDQPIVTNVIKKKKERAIFSVDNRLTEPSPEKQKVKVTSAPKISAVPEVVRESNRMPEIKALPASTKTNAVASKPFLTISGASAASSELAVKLDMSKHLPADDSPVKADSAISPPSATDIMDEVAVMTNRMAQLEKQIVSLQNSNAQLEAAAVKTRVENSRFNWQQILQIALVIITVLVSAEWLRYRALNRVSGVALHTNSLNVNRNRGSSFDEFD